MWDIFRVPDTPDLTGGVLHGAEGESGQKRLLAKPGTRTQRAVVWNPEYVRSEWGFVVRPGAFNPPKVDSAVVTFIPLPQGWHPTDPGPFTSLLSFVSSCGTKQQLQSISLRRAGRTTPSPPSTGLGSASKDSITPGTFQQLAGIFGRSEVGFPEKHD